MALVELANLLSFLLMPGSWQSRGLGNADFLIWTFFVLFLIYKEVRARHKEASCYEKIHCILFLRTIIFCLLSEVCCCLWGQLQVKFQFEKSYKVLPQEGWNPSSPNLSKVQNEILEKILNSKSTAKFNNRFGSECLSPKKVLMNLKSYKHDSTYCKQDDENYA